MSDDELSLEEIEALERKEPPKAREKREVSRWPDEYKEELMIAVIEGADQIELRGRRFTITHNPIKATYKIRPIEGFVPMGEVSEKWLMTS